MDIERDGFFASGEPGFSQVRVRLETGAQSGVDYGTRSCDIPELKLSLTVQDDHAQIQRPCISIMLSPEDVRCLAVAITEELASAKIVTQKSSDMSDPSTEYDAEWAAER